MDSNSNSEFICKLDNSIHNSVDGVHARLRAFKVKQEDYYTTHFPRKDLLTDEIIPYKSYDQYFSAYFANRNNMKAWYKANPEKARILSIELLKQRIARKNLAKMPGEIELISCGLPSSQYYYGTLAKEIQKNALIAPFDYSILWWEYEIPKKIFVDTREQTPLKFKGLETESKTLSFGDYTIDGAENRLVIERKSLADFISSCVSQYDRFTREFERARDAGAYMIVLCEESFNTAQNYIHIPHFKRYTKIRPEAVFHNVRELMQKFDCQFVFCDGRVKSAETAIKILGYKHDIKRVDLQWAVDRAKIL